MLKSKRNETNLKRFQEQITEAIIGRSSSPIEDRDSHKTERSVATLQDLSDYYINEDDFRLDQVPTYPTTSTLMTSMTLEKKTPSQHISSNQARSGNFPSTSTNMHERNGFAHPNSFQSSSSNKHSNARPFDAPFPRQSESRRNRNEDNIGFMAASRKDMANVIRQQCQGTFGTERHDGDKKSGRGFRAKVNKAREFTSEEKNIFNENVRDFKETLKSIKEDTNYKAENDPKIPEIVRKYLKDKKGPENDETWDLVENYQNKVTSREHIKYFDTAKHGYVIIPKTQTREQKEEVDESKKSIFDFVYSSQPDFIKPTVHSKLYQTALKNIERSMAENEWYNIKPEDFSVITKFSEHSDSNFPHMLTSRNVTNGSIRMLRPAIIDGMAVQYMSSGKNFRPFYHCRNSELTIYDPDLVINVRPVFEIVLELLLRGHKTTVCYPKYYEKYITDGKLSKVDNIHAFQTMIDCGLIEFHNCDKEHKYKWFNVLTEIVNKNQAIFVSSVDYDPIKKTKPSYKKESERILTPVFLMLNEVIMIFQPTIRYRVNEKQFKTITADEILYYPPGTNDILIICQQLYLKDQVRQICSLAHSFRLKPIYQWPVKQLLYMLVRTESNIETPYMSRDDYNSLECRTIFYSDNSRSLS